MFFGFTTEAIDGQSGRTATTVLVPFERTTSIGNGTRAAPDAIVAASAVIEEYDEELRVVLLPEDLQMLRWAIPDAADVPACLSALARQCDVIRGRALLFVGGEHLMSLPLADCLMSHAGTLVVFDAHGDAADSVNGHRLSHGTWLRRAIERGHRVVLAGVRSLSASEARFLEESPCASLWTMNRLRSEGFGGLHSELARLAGPVYLSIDIDVLDAALVPSAGSPQPGGFSWDELCQAFGTVFRNSGASVVGADVVEYVPNLVHPLMDVVAAKVCCKILFWYKWRVIGGPCI